MEKKKRVFNRFKNIPLFFWKRLKTEVADYLSKSNLVMNNVSCEQASKKIVDTVHQKLKEQKFIRGWQFKYTTESFDDLCLCVADNVRVLLEDLVGGIEEKINILQRDITRIFRQNIERVSS